MKTSRAAAGVAAALLVVGAARSRIAERFLEGAAGPRSGALPRDRAHQPRLGFPGELRHLPSRRDRPARRRRREPLLLRRQSAKPHARARQRGPGDDAAQHAVPARSRSRAPSRPRRSLRVARRPAARQAGFTAPGVEGSGPRARRRQPAERPDERRAHRLPRTVSGGLPRRRREPRPKSRRASRWSAP